MPLTVLLILRLGGVLLDARLLLLLSLLVGWVLCVRLVEMLVLLVRLHRMLSPRTLLVR